MDDTVLCLWIPRHVAEGDSHNSRTGYLSTLVLMLPAQKFFQSQAYFYSTSNFFAIPSYVSCAGEAKRTSYM